MLTFLPLEQVDEMDAWEGAQLNSAKEILAHELTSLVHGKDEADKASVAAKQVFSGGSSSDMPVVEISSDDFDAEGIGLLKLMVKAKLAQSNREARTMVKQGGVSVNGDNITDEKAKFTKDAFGDDFVLRRGKKKFCKIEVKD
jgi:tyrosyl-tRNA synthetase